MIERYRIKKLASSTMSIDRSDLFSSDPITYFKILPSGISVRFTLSNHIFISQLDNKPAYLLESENDGEPLSVEQIDYDFLAIRYINKISIRALPVPVAITSINKSSNGMVVLPNKRLLITGDNSRPEVYQLKDNKLMQLTQFPKKFMNIIQYRHYDGFYLNSSDETELFIYNSKGDNSLEIFIFNSETFELKNHLEFELDPDINSFKVFQLKVINQCMYAIINERRTTFYDEDTRYLYQINLSNKIFHKKKVPNGCYKMLNFKYDLILEQITISFPRNKLEKKIQVYNTKTLEPLTHQVVQSGKICVTNNQEIAICHPSTGAIFTEAVNGLNNLISQRISCLGKPENRMPNVIVNIILEYSNLYSKKNKHDCDELIEHVPDAKSKCTIL